MYDIEKHSTGCRYTIYIYTYEYINSLRKQMSIVMCSYVFIWDVFFEPVAGSLKKSCFAGSTQCPCSVDNQLRFKLRKVFRLKFMKDLRLMVKGLATWHVRDWVSWLAPTAEPRLTWYKKSFPSGSWTLDYDQISSNYPSWSPWALWWSLATGFLQNWAILMYQFESTHRYRTSFRNVQYWYEEDWIWYWLVVSNIFYFPFHIWDNPSQDG